MIRMAIVEDEDVAADALMDCLIRYNQTVYKDNTFSYTRYRNGNSFLSSRIPFDIIFMDIMLPDINGMDVVTEIRKYDPNVIIIFVTNMIRFAIESYKVDALDYILKPISYERVILKLDKALNIIKTRGGKTIVISNQQHTMKISSADIVYIEVDKHKRIYHLTDNYDDDIKAKAYDHGRLSDIEAELKDYNFLRISSGYLINFEYVVNIKGYDVKMSNGDTVVISHSKRHYFQFEFTNWLGRSK